jgi:hypothetical protein
MIGQVIVVPWVGLCSEADRTRGSGAIALFVVALFLGLTIAPDAAAQAVTTCLGREWRIVPSPNPGSMQNELSGVSAFSPRGAWAVGSRSDAEGPLNPLIERWDGNAWTLVESPTFAEGGDLRGVDAASAKNAWAVGSRGDPTGVFKTVIERWDGDAWRLVPSPNAGLGLPPNGILGGVVALSRRHVWAVGSYLTDPGIPQPLIEHWDGSRWRVVPGPGGLGDSALRALAGTGPSDLWAVGHKTVSVGNQLLIERALILHWDGSRWSEMSATGLGIDPVHPYALVGVAAVSPNDAWAVGSVSSETATRTLILHWDGTVWKRVRSPQPSSVFQSLNSVAAISPKKAWAVGSYKAARPDDVVTMVQLWDGKRWRVIPSENGESLSELFAVTTVRRAQFAVGSYWVNLGGGEPRPQTLVLQGCLR